jgi:hypothetical protein
MKLNMGGYNVEASAECLSEVLLAMGFAMEHCAKNNLPNLGESFYKMHSDLFNALVDCGYFGKRRNKNEQENVKCKI